MPSGMSTIKDRATAMRQRRRRLDASSNYTKMSRRGTRALIALEGQAMADAQPLSGSSSGSLKLRSVGTVRGA